MRWRRRAQVLGVGVMLVSMWSSSGKALDFSAAEGCPDEAAFRDLVVARVGAEGATDAILSVAVVRTDDGYEGEVSVDLDDGPRRRKLSARTCDEVVTGLAIVAAVWIADDTTAVSEPAAVPTAVPVEEDPERPPGMGLPPPEEREEPSEDGEDFGFALGAFFETSVGLAPTVMLGGALRGILGFGLFELALEGRIAATAVAADVLDDVAVRAFLANGAIVACAAPGWFRGCVGVWLGAYQAETDAVSGRNLATTVHSGAEVRAGPRLRLGRVSLELELRLLVPFNRISIRVDDSNVWTAPPVGGVLAIGISVDIS